MARRKGYATVTVTVDMEDFDDEDLISECEERGLTVGFEEADEKVREMFYAFKLGKTDRAMELAREIAQDHTGMILP